MRWAPVVFWVSLAVPVWVYAAYPLCLLLLGRVLPQERQRAPIVLPASVIVAAHNEEALIGSKVRNIDASDYPSEAIEIIVASDGSTDRTVTAARRAGADKVLDLERVGKIVALNRAVEEASGEILVFTDADSRFETTTLRTLVSNFVAPQVAAAAAREVHIAHQADGSVARGESLYWRYEQWIKRLEDRVGSTVSASGRLYAIRRSVFTPTAVTTGTDDFLISTKAITAGQRLVFDEWARVLVDAPSGARAELRRKVRVMNRGLRAAISLGRTLSPGSDGLYAFQLFSHKILRRFVPFFLLALLLSSLRLAATLGGVWWLALGAQLGFYGLGVAGALLGNTRLGRAKVLTVPHFFCMGNLAASLAVLSILAGVKFEKWEPERAGVAKGMG